MRSRWRSFARGDLIADGALAPETPLAHDWEAVEASTLLMIPARGVRSPACARRPELALALGGRAGRPGSSARSSSPPASRWRASRSGSSRGWSRIGRQDGTAGPDGLLIRNRPTQQELANQIGACRETVSRTVSELVRQGLLTPRGRSLLVSKRLVENAA